MTNSNSLNNAAYARSPGRRMASHSEASRIAAEGKYRIIRPLVNSMKLRVWVAGVPQSRVKLLDRLAEKHRVSRRTVYGWLSQWNQGGLLALVRKSRSDKGHPRALNAMERNSLMAVIQTAAREPTLRAIYRVYGNERRRRETMGAENHAIARLPDISFSTLRNWLNAAGRTRL